MKLPPGLTQWTAPQGHADIAPSQHERIEYDGYLTIDAPWIVPALLDGVPAIAGRILEPAAGRTDICRSNCVAGVSRLFPLICAAMRIGSLNELKIAHRPDTTLPG